MRIPPRSLALALVASGVLAISTRAHAANTPPPDDGKTEVHIIAPTTVTLEQLVGSDWVEVCHAPCDERVRVDAKYRTHGEGLRASKPFSLDSRDGSALLEVTPSSERGHRAGVGLLVAGTILLPLGVVTMYLSALTLHGLNTLSTFIVVASFGLMGTMGGLGLLIAGASVLGGGRPTKVTQPDGDAAASVRTPTWTAGLERVPPSSQAFVVPILSGTF